MKCGLCGEDAGEAKPRDLEQHDGSKIHCDYYECGNDYGEPHWRCWVPHWKTKLKEPKNEGG